MEEASTTDEIRHVRSPLMPKRRPKIRELKACPESLKYCLEGIKYWVVVSFALLYWCYPHHATTDTTISTTTTY